VLATGDRHLLDLEDISVTVITPRELVKRLNERTDLCPADHRPG
jgi:predicted nucleic acid-binding protein